MTAGDITRGIIGSLDALDASLTTASVTLVGKPGEIQLVQRGGGMIEWLYIEQA